jgi:hypothetical protein
MKKHPSGLVVAVGLRMLTTDFSKEGGRKALDGTKTGSNFPVMEFLFSGGRNPTLETETLTFCIGRRVLLSTTIPLSSGASDKLHWPARSTQQTKAAYS